MPGSSQRIHALDALRGFAIFGILLINIQIFSGWGFIGLEAGEDLWLGEYDERLDFWLDLLVRAKFYSLFSLLFGYSFRLMADHAGDRALSMHLRRMAGLLLIGLAHSLLLWPWDILLLYAVIGCFLGPFLRSGPMPLLTGGVALLTLTTLLWGLGEEWGLPLGRSEFALHTLQESVPAMASGGYMDVLRANAWLTLSIGQEWLTGLRPLRVLALFLLGAAAASVGLSDWRSTRPLAMALTGLTALVSGLLLSWLEYGHDGELNPWLEAAADVLGPPLLAIGYAVAGLLLWQGRGWLARTSCWLLAPVGRMALTNYLLQSAICVPLFYGFGAGYFADWSLSSQMLFALCLFTGQVLLSMFWLQFFRQGPMERLWRLMIGVGAGWLSRQNVVDGSYRRVPSRSNRARARSNPKGRN